MFWDRVACVYDLFVNGFNRETYEALRKIIGGMFGPGDRVLECACGTGMLSRVIAGKCQSLTATDFSPKMLERAKKNSSAFQNITFASADITALDYPEETFDKVVAGNVLHLLDDPLQALSQLNRVCKKGGQLILPTYMNREQKGEAGRFISTVDRAGAGFRRQFTPESYRAFFQVAGYPDVQIMLANGRIPCAVAVMRKKEDGIMQSGTELSERDS